MTYDIYYKHCRNLPTYSCHGWLAAIIMVQPIKRLITEKAKREAFLPTASIRKTALSEPNIAPKARRLLIQEACESLRWRAESIMEGMADEVYAMQIP